MLLASCSQESNTSRAKQANPTPAEESDNLIWKALVQVAGQENPTLATLDEISTNQDHTTETQKLYLEGLRAAAKGNLSEAAEVFQQIVPSDLPPGLVYPPYRIIHTVSQNEANPFREPMLLMAKKGLLPPLWEARLMRNEGRFMESLTSYWRTSPSEWTAYDVECLAQIALLQGAKPDVMSLGRKAINSKLLNTEIEKALNQEILENSNLISKDSMSQTLKDIQREIDDNTATGREITDSIKQSLELRKSFLEKRYSSIVEQARAKDPILQSDETLLIHFLSASHVGDIAETTRWGQEIERRNKDPETITWVATIIQETRQGVQK
jgi:hypothetical protein